MPYVGYELTNTALDLTEEIIVASGSSTEQLKRSINSDIEVLVFLNNAPVKTDDYSITGTFKNVLTFDGAITPQSGDNLLIRYLGKNIDTTFVGVASVNGRTGTVSIITNDLVGVVATNSLQDKAVTSAKLAYSATVDGERAVSAEHLKDNSVTTNKILNNTVSDAKLQSDINVDSNRAVGTNHIKTSAVTTPKIADNAVTSTKLDLSYDNDAAATSAGVGQGDVYFDTSTNRYKVNRDGIAAVEIVDTSGAQTIDGSLTVGSLTVSGTTTLNGGLDADVVDTQSIQDKAVTSDKLSYDSTVDANRSVGTDHIKDAAVTTAKIASSAVTDLKLATNSVTTTKIADSNVTTEKIADSSVTTSKINGSAVTTSKIADANVTTAKIADANITDAKLASSSVTSAKIADLNVTEGKLAASAVTTAKIADASVTNTKIADASVTTTKIADANVTTAKIADANVTQTKLATDSVSNAKIVDSAVTTAKIADANITQTKLATDSVTTAKIADSNVTTAKIADANVTESKLATDSVSTTKIANNAVSSAKLSSSPTIDADRAVGTNHLKDFSVTNAKLAGLSVSESKIIDASVTTAKIADANVTTAKIADDAVTNAKIGPSAVGTTEIADSAVTTAKIADANVTTSKIADANVTTAKIADLNVTTDKIADLGVTTAKIDNLGITEGKIAGSAVTTAKIADANVTTAKIADANVTTAKIADANVTTAKIADLNVTTGKIADDAITAAKLANNSVDTAAIIDGNVSTSKLAADAVDGTKIADDSIDSEHYVDGSIDTAHIGDSQVTTAKIADANVTTAKIADANVTTAKIADANVTDAKLAANSVTTAKISDLNVTTAKLAAGAVTSAKLGADSVDGTKIADDSIDSEHYVDGSIDTAHIGDSQVTTAKIADTNVTTAKIADSNVTTAKIADANVTDVKLASNSVTTAKIADANVTTVKLADDAVTSAKLDISLANAAAATSLTAEGDIYYADDTDRVNVYDGAAWRQLLDTHGNQTITNDLTISGDLFVTGTTTYSNTTNLDTDAAFITLNTDVTGAPSEDAYLEVERGTSTNVRVQWNETNDRWEFTNDGSTYYNIPVQVSDLSNDANYIDLGDISVTVASAGASTLSYDNSTGILTYTPPDLSGFATTTALSTAVANSSNWDTAYGWGNHATQGYLTSETSHADVVIDGDFTSSGLMTTDGVGGYSVTTNNSSNWNTAYGWGDHSTAGYLTSETSHADVVVDGDFASAGLMTTDGSGGYSVTVNNATNWNTAYGWGDHSTAGYLTAETSHADVVVDGDFTANGLLKRTGAGTYTSVTDNSSNWDTAYGWGDHSTAGYLTSQTSHADVVVDGDFTSAGLMTTDGSGTYSVTTNNSSNWDTAYGWGDHSTAGYLTSYTETQTLDDVLTLGASTTQDITTTGKILFANMYATTGDLPSATTYHGMFAHVHGTGKGYFAHAGNWTQLLDTGSSINELNDVDTSTTSPSAGDALVWNSSSSKWLPTDIGLTVKETVGDGGTENVSVSDVKTIIFDNSTGFNVTDKGSGSIFVSLGSSFATWKVSGQNDLVAQGEDTMEFIAGTGITIATNTSSTPKSITFSASGGGGGIALTDLSVTTNSASGGGSLSYDNTTGVFSFTPPSLSSYLTGITSESIASLSDVSLSSPQTNDVLQYNGTSWVNAVVQSGSATAIEDGDFTANGLMKRTGAGTYTTITDNSSNWNTAYGWGDHSTAGYITSYTVQASDLNSISIDALSDVDTTSTAPSSGDVLKWDGSKWAPAADATGAGGGGGITQETDPVFLAAAASSITSTDITNWNTAYGWGNHASAGYLTSVPNASTTVYGKVKIDGVSIQLNGSGQIYATGISGGSAGISDSTAIAYAIALS